MIAIYTQNRQAVWNFADISRFHVTGNGTGMQAVAKNGAGGELARYKNREYCRNCGRKLTLPEPYRGGEE